VNERRQLHREIATAAQGPRGNRLRRFDRTSSPSDHRPEDAASPPMRRLTEAMLAQTRTDCGYCKSLRREIRPSVPQLDAAVTRWRGGGGTFREVTSFASA